MTTHTSTSPPVSPSTSASASPSPCARPSPYSQVDTPSATTAIWQVWHTVSADQAATSDQMTAVTTALSLGPPTSTPAPGPDVLSLLSTILLVVGIMALLLTAVLAVWEAWYTHQLRQQRQIGARKRRIAQDAAALHSVLAAQAFQVHQEMVREAVRHQRR